MKTYYFLKQLHEGTNGDYADFNLFDNKDYAIMAIRHKDDIIYELPLENLDDHIPKDLVKMCDDMQANDPRILPAMLFLYTLPGMQ